MWSAQQLAKVATATTANGLPDIKTGFTAAERQLVASRIIAKCDALDGASDGMVQDIKACQANFSLATDVPTCSDNVRDGTCLTSAQKDAVGNVFSGARNSAGTALYASFPYDAGLGARLVRMEAGQLDHARSGRGRLHVHHAAAKRFGAEPLVGVRAELQHGQRRAEDLRHQRRV